MSSATTVVICTINRPTIVDETLRSLFAASSFHSDVVVSSGSATSLLPETLRLAGIQFVEGVKGLTRQRNAALHQVNSRFVLFLDDDVELDAGYIDRMEALFEQHPEIVIACGHAVLDRLETRYVVTREMALAALAKVPRGSGWDYTPRWIRGHNMFVRADIAKSLQFDERLPLYALYEDLDFVARCQKYGKAAYNRESRMAHLGTMSGRINEVRLGYSQFANSHYLVRKGIWALPVVARVCAKQLAGNLAFSLLKRQVELADRRSRLKGNLFALADLFRGRLDPANILVL